MLNVSRLLSGSKQLPAANGTFCFRQRSEIFEYVMLYLRPIADADIVLDEALDIALDYLEFTNQAVRFSETQSKCAGVILHAWRAGVKHGLSWPTMR